MAIRALTLLGWLAISNLILADAPRKLFLDSHGFPLPEGASARLGDLHFAQPGTITALALSPDGKVIATAGRGVFLWNATGRITRSIKTAHAIRTLSFSQHGKLLAGASEGGEILVWDTRTGNEMNSFSSGREDRSGDLPKLEPPWRDTVRTEWTGLRFVDHDRLLATTCVQVDSQFRRDCRMQVWKLDDKSLIQSWDTDKARRGLTIPRGNELSWVALAPSGEQAAWLTAPFSLKEGNCSVSIQDTRSGAFRRQVNRLPAPAERICFCDAKNNVLLQSTYYRWKPSAVKDGYIESEGNHVVVSLKDGKPRFAFDYRMANHLSRPLGEGLYVRVLAHSPDGKQMFTRDEGVVRWNLSTGKASKFWNESWSGLAFSQDGERAVIACGARLYVCDQDLQPLRKQDDFSEAPRVHFRGDGTLMALSRRNGPLRLWDVNKRKVTERVLPKMAPPEDRARSTCDAAKKVFAYVDGNVVPVHDLLTDKELCRLDLGELQSTWDVWPSLSPDGTRVLVAICRKDSILVQWFESRSSKKLGEHSIPNNEFFDIHCREVNWYSANGSVFGYVAPDRRLALVDSLTNKACLRIGIADREPRSPGEDRGFFPWEYRRAALDRMILAARKSYELDSIDYCLWERHTGRMLRRFQLAVNESAGRNSVVAPDGRLVAVWGCSSRSHEIDIFDTLTGRLRGKLIAPSDVESIDFSPDGKILASSCADTSILLWDLQRPLGTSKSHATRLNDGEMESAWNRLGEPDPGLADAALWSMVSGPEQALPLLKKRLAPMKTPDPKEVQSLIAALDSSSFREREAAKEKLILLDAFVFSALQESQKEQGSLEQSRRIQSILRHIGPDKVPPALREVRAIEVLERIGSREARRLVASIAGGDDNAFLTREAQRALARMAE